MVEEIRSPDQYNKYINSAKPAVILFQAEWAEQCKQVLEVLRELSKILGDKIQFGSMIAENFEQISFDNKIHAVPTVIFFTKGEATDRINGIDIAKLTEKCKTLAATTTTNGSDGDSLNDRLKALINKAKVMIFMKGSRDAPRCGFSKQLISIVNDIGIDYETFDILMDEDVRQGLKTYSDWPTYPQVYVNGELIGGLDIIKEMLAGGELESALKA